MSFIISPILTIFMDGGSPLSPLVPCALTCAGTPALCCRHGWWQGPVCWMWCGRGKVTVWCCPNASTLESGPWRENEFYVKRADEQLWLHPLPKKTWMLPFHLDTMCRIAKRRMRGATATRNHGKTPAIIPTQKKTRITFWMNISAWNGRRTSTREIIEGQVSGCGGPQTGKTEPNIFKKQKRGSLKSLSEIWVLPFKQSDFKKKNLET